MSLLKLDHVLDRIPKLNVTRMVAYDADGFVLDSAQTETPAQLVEAVRTVVENSTGIIRIDGYSVPPPREPGQRKADAPKGEHFTWHVRYQPGQAPAAAPAAQPIQGAQADFQTLLQLERTKWELEDHRRQLRELKAREVIPDDDTDEEPEEPPGLLGMNQQQTYDFLRELHRDLRSVLIKSPIPENPNATAQQPVTGAPAGAPAGDTAEEFTATEKRLIIAWRNMAQVMPDVADKTARDLLANFENPGTTDPPKDGK